MPSMLFVCHANIARSASAELLARHHSRTDSGWQFASAGVSARVGQAIDPEIAAALHRRGVDTAGHRARQADSGLFAQADLVLVFESSQRDWVLREAPRLMRSTFTIRRAAHVLRRRPRRAEPLSFLAADEAPYTDADDFADPYGRGPAAAEHAVNEITELLARILPAWEAGAASPSSAEHGGVSRTRRGVAGR